MAIMYKHIKNEVLREAYKIIEELEEKSWEQTKELKGKLPECLDKEEIDRILNWGWYKQEQGYGLGLQAACLAISDLDEMLTKGVGSDEQKHSKSK